MAVSTTKFLVTGLSKKKLTQLASNAEQLGMTPEKYVKELVERDLKLGQPVQPPTLAQLFGEGQEVDEEELDRLVDQARNRHHARITKKR